MKIDDFWKIFESQSKILINSGFEFKKKCWQLEADNYIISYEAPTNKFGVGLQVRFLTLCILHKEIWPETDKVKKTNDISKDSILRISPQILPKYKKAIFKDRVWHFTHSIMDGDGFKYSFMPVYYGGEEKWIMKDDSFSVSENQESLLNTLNGMFNINYIEEKVCIDYLQQAAKNIRDFGLYWAERLTPKSALYQLEKYGDDWWISNEWIKAYKNATQQ